MRVWTNRTFQGHYPVGAAAVVVADFQSDAAMLLLRKLNEIGIPQGVPPNEMIELNTEVPSVTILRDGDY